MAELCRVPRSGDPGLSPPPSIPRAVAQPLSSTLGYFSCLLQSQLPTTTTLPAAMGLFGSSGPNSGLHGLKRTGVFARDNGAPKLLVLCRGLAEESLMLELSREQSGS